MRLRLLPALALLPGTLAISAATYASGEIIHNPRNSDTPVEMSWKAVPAKVYDVEAADQLDQPWEVIKATSRPGHWWRPLLTRKCGVPGFTGSANRTPRHPRSWNWAHDKVASPCPGKIVFRLASETGVVPLDVLFILTEGQTKRQENPKLT